VAHLVTQTLTAIESNGIDSVARVRQAFDRPAGKGLRLVAPSPAVAAGKKELETFLYRRVYRSGRVMEVRTAAQEKLTRLFHWYVDHPDEMPAGFRGRAAQWGVPRSVADYIGGMTDRYLEWDYQRRLGSV
jgi:dGTPase